MAAEELDIDRETFCCFICLDLLKDPVTIPCGDSFCMSCVSTHWDRGEGKSYCCPQCRQSFRSKPVLVKNTMLAALVEELNRSEVSADLCSAGYGDVACDLCSGRKVKAIKSCLLCHVSYCKEHLQPHYDVPAFNKHKLIEPTENLQENICSRHNEFMKMFCRTDQQGICYLCAVDLHKGHDTVTAAAEMADKNDELNATSVRFFRKLDKKDGDLEQLQRHMLNNRYSVYAAVVQSDQSLKELLHLLDKRINDVKQLVRSQQEAEELRVKELQDKVQQDIKELKRTLSELDSLSHIEDPVQFLHKFSSLSKISETSDSVNSSLTPPPFEDIVRAAVSKLRSILQDTNLDPPAVQLVEILPLQLYEPFNIDLKILEDLELKDLQRYSRKLTFDPQSLNYRLELSNNDTVVKRLLHKHKYPPHPDRFISAPQVVTKESLTGRCFWQVLVNYRDDFGVAVSYRSIMRSGSHYQSGFGQNNVASWLLKCYSYFRISHNFRTYELRFEGHESCTSPIKIGIFLDHDAGILAFYRVYEDDVSVQLLYTVRTTFTQPLVAGVVLENINSTAQLL